MAPLTYLTNVQSFCAAHRLHNPEMTYDENKKYFGRCNNENSHGHNYKIEATVEGQIDPKLGFAMNLTDLKKYLLQVIDPMDHKRIDVDIPFFQKPGMIATAENIAIYIWQELEKLLPSNVKMYNLRVHETEKCYVDYRG